MRDVGREVLAKHGLRPAPRVVEAELEETDAVPPDHEWQPPDTTPDGPNASASLDRAHRTAPIFAPVAIDDVQVSAAAAWLIHNLVPARGLACVVGPPKSGKSFLATDMLFA